MLETREVPGDIKTRFFELVELTLGFTPEQKDRYLSYVVGTKSKKFDRADQKTAAKDALTRLHTRRRLGIYRRSYRRDTSKLRIYRF